MPKVGLMLKRLRTGKRHSGAGGFGLLRLIRQGLPYLLNRKGFAFPPLTMFFSVNSVCNLKCRMCDIGQNNADSMFYKNLKGETGRSLSIERFKSLIDEVKDFRPYIGFTTTEPLMYRHVFEAVRHSKQYGMETNISTNGVLIEKHVGEILDSGLHRLSVSLDGPAAVHDEMRGVPGTFEAALRGIRAVAEEKRRRGTPFPQIYVSSFLCDKNSRHVLEFVRGLPLGLLDRVNIKLMSFVTREVMDLHNQAHGDRYPATFACIPSDFTPDDIDIPSICEQMRAVRAECGDTVQFHFEDDPAYLKKYFFDPARFVDGTKCVIPWFVAQITTDFDLIGLTRCYNVKLGNVADKPFAEAWNGEAMRRFRMDLQRFGRFPGCTRCDGVLYR